MGTKRVFGKAVPETSALSVNRELPRQKTCRFNPRPLFSIGTHRACRWKVVQRFAASDARCDEIPASGLARIREGCLPEGADLQPCLEAEDGNLFAAFTPLPATGLRMEEPIAGPGAKKQRLDQRCFFVPPDPTPPKAAFRGSFRPGMVRRCHTPGPFLGTKALPVREPRFSPGSLVCQRLHWEESTMKTPHA